MVKEQLDYGKTEVRSILGTEGVLVTDAEIEESLWHYYYDVDKTVNYLRGMWSFFLVRCLLLLTRQRALGQINPQPKKSKKKTGLAEKDFSKGRHVSTSSLSCMFSLSLHLHSGYAKILGEIATMMAWVF